MVTERMRKEKETEARRGTQEDIIKFPKARG